MVARQICEALLTWLFSFTRLRTMEKETFYSFLWIVGIFDCYLGGGALFVTHTTYYISYKCGIYMMVFCWCDMYWWSGTLTGYIYVILFTCNAWWCKKYALTARCRGCWVNPKEMISLPCKCLIYCQDRCARRHSIQFEEYFLFTFLRLC